MRKTDMTTPALIAEALDIILGLAYIGLQIFYGICYHVAAYKVILNVLVLLLVYAGLTLLAIYPERLNRINPEFCVGEVRKYSLRMVRAVKFIFILGLLVPCICDAAGHQIPNAYSLIMIGVILIISIYYEYRIIKGLKK